MVPRRPVPKPMYTAAAFARGMKIEQHEHHLPVKFTRKLVTDHLTENPRYYKGQH